jgi:hypothetical protein
VDGGDVLEAAGECQALLGAAVDRDWTTLPALLWANGRVALPGHPRQARWRWHCAPLEEWDGVNPADRR